MKIDHIVAARHSLSRLISGPNVPDAMLAILIAAHDALLAEERKDPAGQKAAFAKIGNDEWMIG